MAVAFAEKYSVIGFDINQSRVEELEAGSDRTLAVEDKMLAFVKSNLTCASDIDKIEDCNISLLCQHLLIR